MPSESTKILVVEDNDFDFDLLERKLKSMKGDFITKRVLTEQEFCYQLSDFHPHLILSDYSLPSFSGPEALKIAKESYPLIPFIFVSGTISTEIAIETLKQGANDYVLKGNLNKLEPAIERALNEVEEKNRRQTAEQKLEIKMQELKTLVYRISHDIRGPICTLKGAVNLMFEIENREKSEYTDYLNIIGQVTQKMDGIVLNLSSFQHIYSDEIKQYKINIKNFISELKQNISQIDGFDKTTFNITLQKSSDFFISEPNLLFCLFYNLIHNAFVFSDKSKSEKIISCHIDSSEDGIELVVEDNGIGIPESIKDKIFNMFFRGSHLSKGAGLGLYVLKNVLDRLNGNIELESDEGLGTRIKVNVPSLVFAETKELIVN